MDLQNVASAVLSGDKFVAQTMPQTNTQATQTNTQATPQSQDGQTNTNVASNANDATRPVQEGAQPTQAAAQSLHSKEEILQILQKILQAIRSGQGIGATNNNLNAASVEKLTAQMQSSAQNAQKFAELVQEAMRQFDGGGEISGMSPQEKELFRAILKEIENFIRNTSPASPIANFLEKLPKNATLQDLLVWAAEQLKNGNLPVRELLATPQILLGNANLRQDPINILLNTVFANKQSPEIPQIPAQQTTPQTAQPQTTSAQNTANMPQNVPTQSVQNANMPQNVPTQSVQNANMPQNVPTQSAVLVQQTGENIRENLQNLIGQTKHEGTKNLLNEILRQIGQKNENVFAFAKVETANIGKEEASASQARFVPLTLHTRFNGEFVGVMSKHFPELSQELLTDTANAVRASEKPITLSPSVLNTLRNILSSINPAPQTNANIVQNPQIPAQQTTPQTAQPQTTSAQNTANIVQNANATQNVPTQSVQNANMPLIDTARPAQTPNPMPTQASPQNAALQMPQATIQATQTQENPTQTPAPQTNANIVQNANMPQNDTARPAQNDTARPAQNDTARPAQINANLTQETNMPLIDTARPTPYKITPSILLNLLQYLTQADKNDALLQVFRADFGTQKSVENILTQAKDLMRSVENTSLAMPELAKAFEKLSGMENLLKNAEIIFKRENAIEYLLEKTGILQTKLGENATKEQKGEENLRNVLREISQQVRAAAQKLENLPNAQTQEKLSETMAKLREFSASVNDLARKMDAANLLANKVDINAGRSEQTLLVPVQIGDAWIQMELRVNRDDKNKRRKGKKQAEQVEINVELEKGNVVSAKANLTLEKQLQINMNFTSGKMLDWFKQNYIEFHAALENCGAKSVSVGLGKKQDKKETRTRENVSAAQKSNFDIVG